MFTSMRASNATADGEDAADEEGVNVPLLAALFVRYRFAKALSE